MGRDGLTSRVTSGGIPVLRVHYSSDPNKDPRTPEGQAWIARAVQGYPQGLHDPAWQKEMEIRYGALGGTVLFGLWARYAQSVVIPPLAPDALPGARYYGTYDYGWVHPSAYHVHCVVPDGTKYTVWEFCGSKIPVQDQARIIKGQDVRLSDGRLFRGNPYAGREIQRLADPQIFENRGQRDSTTPLLAVGELFKQYGVLFQKGRKGGDLMVANWLIGDLWANPAAIRYFIFATCTQLLYELPRLKHKQISATQARIQADPEALIDKDNDAWDSLKQFLRLFPSTVAAKPARAIQGTFAWWQKSLTHQRTPLKASYVRR